MKVITLYQPWATWVIDGHKKIETRTHNRFKTLKGQRILIHAGKKYSAGGALQLFEGIHIPESFPRGVILGSVYVYKHDICSPDDNEYANIDCESIERFGLFLKDIEKFKEPIPVKGQMGIWNYDL